MRNALLELLEEEENHEKMLDLAAELNEFLTEKELPLGVTISAMLTEVVSSAHRGCDNDIKGDFAFMSLAASLINTLEGLCAAQVKIRRMERQRPGGIA